MRILFLDDDPLRAEAFVETWPEAVWVTTVEECLCCLEEPWDEVHLDHDLGGESYVDHDRDDCGMAVVRWLTEEPRPHLLDTQFIIHTHNENAACIMGLHLEVTGYRVKVQPFGRRASAPPANRAEVPGLDVPWTRRLADWLLGRTTPRSLL